ncbi:MAG: chemotaxis protein CheW, partial [Desulfobulbaceae bacterium]|nr:chemotaxis protein CheW [Desulfobulbaceae bacterium]
NLDKLGGLVEIVSEIDKGTVIRIKLPLTLAIIPSLLVASCEERYALPQVNVVELQRIHAGEIREKIRKIGGADVLLLRGELIPLLQLGNVLEQQHFYYDPKEAEFRIDRRKGLVDQRLYPESDLEIDKSKEEKPEDAPERRSDRKSDVNIVIVQAGSFKYGIVVDKIHDTVEIVVKPLGRHLKKCNIYAGATIMGDGRVALILDVAGMGRNAELNALKETEKISGTEKTGQAEKSDTIRQSLLLFRNGPEEHCAVPLSLVQRIEQIMASDIEISGGKKVIQYRGGVLPVYALEEVANVEMLEESEKLDVILFMVNGHEVGLLSVPPLDVLELDFAIDETTLRQQGISGSVIIDGRTTLLVDISEIVRSLNPEWFKEDQAGRDRESMKIGGKGSRAILLVEDSQFFRTQVKSFIEDEGHAVIEAEDGLKAWEYLNERGDEIGLVVTDIEMPNMDGFELAGKIKNDERFAHLAVIALTSLAGKEDIARGREVGIDEYQVKLDRDNLIRSIGNLFK